MTDNFARECRNRNLVRIATIAATITCRVTREREREKFELREKKSHKIPTTLIQSQRSVVHQLIVELQNRKTHNPKMNGDQARFTNRSADRYATSRIVLRSIKKHQSHRNRRLATWLMLSASSSSSSWNVSSGALFASPPVDAVPLVAVDDAVLRERTSDMLIVEFQSKRKTGKKTKIERVPARRGGSRRASAVE